METKELTVLRRQTEQFIKENPTSITLSRPVRTSNGKGGWTTVPTPQTPQTFRIIPQGNGVASKNVDGDSVAPVFVMIGRWDANVTAEDTFSLGGRNYNVSYVRGAGITTAYESWVEVVYSG